MDRAGGYLAYRALLEDARAYDDLLLVMEGEYEAARIRKLQARTK